MKNLNRKGFTLVELLAVIVILAIVVGIALVTVLPTLEKSRQKSFDVAVDAIRTYIQDQVDLSQLGGSMIGDDNTTYNSAVAEATCTTAAAPCNGSTGDLLSVTGYSNNISAIQWHIEKGVAKIDCATANANGDYRQSDNYNAC